MKKNKQKSDIKPLILAASLMFLAGTVLAPRCVSAQEQYQQVPVLIQISSSISDGYYAPQKIVDIARKAGFKSVIFTEREIMRWEYGLWPLRNIIKKVVENNSLATFGITNYFKSIKVISEKSKDMIVIPAVESTPFYFWSGNIFKKNFTLNDAHKHLLIIGLNAEALARLPIAANRFSLYKQYKIKDIFYFWPIAVLLLGSGFFFSLKQTVFRNTLEKEAYRHKKAVAIAIMIIGLLFAVNNFPFKPALFDQYHGDQGILPYQNMINYVNNNNGLVFWAHPEAINCSKTKYVDIVTKQHVPDFYNTRDYTGYSIFYEGYNSIGKPGGVWDKVLGEYSDGKRSRPVWAIGGQAFDYSGDLSGSLKDLRNMLLLDDFSDKGVLAALRKGRLYVLRGADSARFILDQFSVQDANSQETKIMGQTLFTDSRELKIRIKGHFLDRDDQKPVKLNIALIKNGKIINTLAADNLFDIDLSEQNPQTENAFYRIEIKANNLQLITNPIFVKSLKK